MLSNKIHYGKGQIRSVLSHFTNCFCAVVIFGGDHGDFFQICQRYFTITYMFLINWILENSLSRVMHVHLLLSHTTSPSYYGILSYKLVSVNNA